MDKDIVISIKTVLFTLLLFFGAYLLYQLGPLLIIIVVSMILVISLEPAVKFFMNKHFMNKPIPRSLAVMFTFVIFIISVLFILVVGVPPVVSQAKKLIINISTQLSGLPGFEEYKFLASGLLNQLSEISGNAIPLVFSVFSNVFTVITVLVLALYMSIDWENIKERALEFFPTKVKKELKLGIDEVELDIGHWVKGQLLLMLFVGFLSFFGLLILGVDYPLALGLISGLLEIVPLLGPILSAVLAGIVGFSESSLQGFAVLGLFFLIQQVENNLLVPKIMQKVSGFSPLVVLVALLIGSNLFGAVGAVLAVPVMMIIVIAVRRFLKFSDS